MTTVLVNQKPPADCLSQGIVLPKIPLISIPFQADCIGDLGLVELTIDPELSRRLNFRPSDLAKIVSGVLGKSEPVWNLLSGEGQHARKAFELFHKSGLDFVIIKEWEWSFVVQINPNFFVGKGAEAKISTISRNIQKATKIFLEQTQLLQSAGQV